MSVRRKNRELYELMLGDQNMSEPIEILAYDYPPDYPGYPTTPTPTTPPPTTPTPTTPAPCECELEMSIDASISEQNRVSGKIVLGTITASGACEQTLSVEGLPSFVSERDIGDNTTEYYIPEGVSLDYEVYGTGQTSTSWDITAVIGDCTGIGTITLNDVNDEPPSIGSISTNECQGFNGKIGNVSIGDDDITDSFREVSISIEGPNAGNFSVSPTQITAPGSVEVFFNASPSNPGLYRAQIIADDGVSTATGNLYMQIIGPSYASLNTYNYISNIPQGLYSSGNPIVLGHHIVAEDVDLTSSLNCDNCTIFNTFHDIFARTGELTYNIANNISNKITIEIISGINTYVAGDSISGGGRLYFSPFFEEDCCGFIDYNYNIEANITSPLESFATGIGPIVPFSGGSGNVEFSYFEPLGQKNVILVPQATGTPLSSNDDYFYLYTYGSRTLSGIKHPAATGISEVVGSNWYATSLEIGITPALTDIYVLCRYASDPNSFFRYNTITDTWTTIIPFTTNSYVSRIIRLDGNFNKYLIVGDASGEYSVYNSLDNSLNAVQYETPEPILLPENINLIPNKNHNCFFGSTNQFSDVPETSLDRVAYNNTYYIFAIDHHYDSTNSAAGRYKYPLILNLNNYTISNGSITIEGAGGRTYLDSYLNYRTDVINVSDKIAISLSNTGNNTSEILIIDNTISTLNRLTKTDTERRRLTPLINGQILWSSHQETGTSTVIDPFSISEYDFPIALTGKISIAESCNTEFRTLMLNSSGNKAYILNDLDRTWEELSFTGNLPMGTYHDIFVFDHLINSIDQAHNFYLMPTQTYEPGFPTGNLVAISTTTIGATGIEIIGNFEVDETVIAFEPIQTTTGQIEIGSFTIGDDEFSGGVLIGFDSTLGDGNVFTANITGDSGVIYVKSGIALDYETKSVYTGYVTGIDPYVGGSPFIDTFIMNVLNIDEKPIDINISPDGSGTVNANIPINTNLEIATFEVIDPDGGDSPDNNNIIEVAGPDHHIFTTTFSNDNQIGSLYIKAGTVFDPEIQNKFDITLLAAKSGTTFTASEDWTLYLTDDPPYGVLVNPTTTGLYENYIIPSTGLRLASFSLLDNDTNIGNFAELIGPDASYFSITYDLASNFGILTLAPGNAFDYETKRTVTGLIGAGNSPGVYSATGTYIINILDIFEPTGIKATPSIVYIDEDVDTSTGAIFLSELSWSDASITGPMAVFDFRYSGGSFRSALDKFQIIDNSTETPEVFLRQNAVLDYETQNRYDIYISGRPSSSTTDLYGGYLIVIVNDVNEAPIITFNPASLTIPENIDTSAGSFKVADVLVLDENQSTVSLSLTGPDSEYFTLDTHSNISNSISSVDMADLYFNSGTSLDSAIKDKYTGSVIAVDDSGLSSTVNFIITLDDIAQCDLLIEADITNTRCAGQNNGMISLDISYTGNAEDVVLCNAQSPISVRWNNLPDGANAGLAGTVVNNLPAGNYIGYIYGGGIPLTGISYTVSSISDLQIIQTIKDNSQCETSGTLTVTWSGGVPPYFVSYGSSSAIVPSGSGFSANLNVFQNTTANPIVRDGAGCQSSGNAISFSLPDQSIFTFDSESLPLIYNDTSESFRFSVEHGIGPYQVNLYNTTTGEKGTLEQTFDRFDTRILDRVEKLNNIVTDEDGNQSIRLNNANPEIYYYDFKNQLYPGRYLFEFINANGCSFLSEAYTVSNIQPLSLQIDAEHDAPVDNGFYTISQPILDTLFIPYKMLLDNNDLLSYLSNITEKSDIKIEVGGTIYERKSLYGSINCDSYSLLNIKFLGINETDWYYTLPIYQGWDITDQEVDILNEQIFLILPNNQKIKVVTELNNNINTIKLLKGSVLTTDSNTSQYKNGYNISLSTFNFDISEFESMDTQTTITDTTTLINKYIPGSIFRIEFLNHSVISQDIDSRSVSSISFDCKTQQSEILNYRKFLISLNTFGLADNIYAKSLNRLLHSASINATISGGYDEYIVRYFYYNKQTKCLSSLKINNSDIDTQSLEQISDGIYILKIRDVYGNKIGFVNGGSYDYYHVSALDFIINELNTTAELLNFEYGDILINIVDLTKVSDPPDPLPGIQNPQEPTINNPEPPITVQTKTYELSPNTTYNNSMIIQTEPSKVSYIVTGPFGYSQKFNDRSVLVQMPPGVYTIRADADSLRSRYLYQQTKSINVNKNTNIFVSLQFDSYQDRVIIQDICQNK